MPVSNPTAVADALPPAESAVEVGVGTFLGVAQALADQGVAVTVTDIERRSVPPSIQFVVDDVTSPELDVYAGVDLVYAINCPPDLQPAVVAVAREVGAACRFTILGGDSTTVPCAPTNVGETTVYVPRIRGDP